MIAIDWASFDSGSYWVGVVCGVVFMFCIALAAAASKKKPG